MTIGIPIFIFYEVNWVSITSHKISKKRETWTKNVSRGLVNFESSNYKTVCSNHFVDAKPTTDNPHPTLYLKASEMTSPSPRKRKAPNQRSSSTQLQSTTSTVCSGVQCTLPVRSALVFAHFSQSSDVNFYTGFPNAEAVRML